MMNSNQFDVDLVTLDNILIVNAAIDNKNLLAKIDEGVYSVQVNYDFQPAVNVQLKKVRLIFACDIKTEEVTASFNIAFFYSVDNFEQLVHVVNNEIKIDIELMTMLANLAYSTSRGIIYSRCQGTVLKDIILPIQSNKVIRAKIEEREKREGR